MSVIIVGGGITGAVLALAISQLTNGQLPVHLIETVDPQVKDYPGLDARAIALAQGTCQQLSRIGIWKEIARYTTPIKTIHISECGCIGFININAKNYHIDALGQVVELNKIRLCLFRLLQAASGVTLHCPALITCITRNEHAVSVMLDKGEILEAQLLIAADGSRSKLASQYGIKWKEKPYSQVAVTTNVSTAVDHEWGAWERFTEYGPLAMLPISSRCCSLVWCHALDKKDEVLAWSDERFCTELQKVFGWRLGHIIHVDKRIAHPLTLIIATRYIAHRMVLVGDAAQTIHPIAGQGFNLGLRDAISLAEILKQTWSNQQDCGAYSVLNCYQQRRQLDKLATISITDNLITFFANRWIPLVIGRNIGLITMELFTPAFAPLVHRMLGWVAY